VRTPPHSPPSREALSNRRADPTFEPRDTPVSRRELDSTRSTPPITRYRSRMQALHEIPEEPEFLTTVRDKPAGACPNCAPNLSKTTPPPVVSSAPIHYAYICTSELRQPELVAHCAE
jgi:hypothetical protein